MITVPRLLYLPYSLPSSEKACIPDPQSGWFTSVCQKLNFAVFEFCVVYVWMFSLMFCSSAETPLDANPSVMAPLNHNLCLVIAAICGCGTTLPSSFLGVKCRNVAADWAFSLLTFFQGKTLGGVTVQFLMRSAFLMLNNYANSI